MSYLWNALATGMALAALAYFAPRLFRIIRAIVVMCLPFGLVAGWHVIGAASRAVRKEMNNTGEADNVVSIDQAKGGRK